MKKVFAFLSVLALFLMVFGLAFTAPYVNAADEPAEGKFFVDPTLEEGDIPMYVMNSIYTTFPQYFDYEGAKGTEYEDLLYTTGRAYPWNETKLIIPQYDLTTGQPTKQRYAVYIWGGLSAPEVSSGNRVYTWELQRDKDGELVLDEFGNVIIQAGENNRGKFTAKQAFGSPSLDGVRINYTGLDFVTTTKDLKEDGNLVHNVIFDGNGKMVRGFTKQSTTDPTNPAYQPSIFGFINGELVLRELYEDSQLDEATELVDTDVPLLDEHGQPMLDADGNPMYEQIEVGTGVVKLADSPEYRYLWQYFTAEQFATQKVNTVPYMTAGWLADRWDYVKADGDGFICIAVIGGDSQYGALTEAQKLVHNASVDALAAAGETDLPNKIAEILDGENNVTGHAAYVRPAYTVVYIPAGGVSYVYGYLSYFNNNTLPMLNLFCDLVTQGYYFGRSEDYNAYVKAYNFSSTGLEFKSAVVDGNSYIQTGKQNVIEVLQGTSFKPASVINQAGALGGFTDLTDLRSYRAVEASKLSYSVSIDGVPTVFPLPPAHVFKYDTFAKMKEAFLTDLYQYLVDHPVLHNAAGRAFTIWDETHPLPTLEDFIASKWGTYLGFTAGSINEGFYILWSGHYEEYQPENSEYFFEQEGIKEKWGFVLDHYVNLCLALGLANPTNVANGGSFSNYTPALNFRRWMNQEDTNFNQTNIAAKNILLPDGVNKYSAFPIEVEESGYVQVMPLTFAELVIETANRALNETIVVDIDVLNTATGVSSSYQLKYVVVDAYTPIIKVNNNLVFDATTTSIDLATLATAYDHYYDAKNGQLLGHDITYKMEYDLPAGFDPENVKPGKYTIGLSVQNRGMTVKEKVTITVRDNVKPILYLLEVVYIPFGGTFDPKAAIVVAYDNVDGNLLNAPLQHLWLAVDDSKLDNEAAGEQFPVTITVKDSSGNFSSQVVFVVVGSGGSAGKNYDTQINDLQSQINAIKNDIKALKDGTSDPSGDSEAACDVMSSVVLTTFAAAAALALLVFKKKQ